MGRGPARPIEFQFSRPGSIILKNCRPGPAHDILEFSGPARPSLAHDIRSEVYEVRALHGPARHLCGPSHDVLPRINHHLKRCALTFLVLFREKNAFRSVIAPKIENQSTFWDSAIQLPVQKQSEQGPRCHVSVFYCGQRSDVNHTHHPNTRSAPTNKQITTHTSS